MKNPHFNSEDKKQLCQHGLSEETVCAQLKLFEDGIPFVRLVQAATINDGITKLDDDECNRFVETYEASDADTVKFVPASGSATRMFKGLHQFLDHYNPDEHRLAEFLSKDEFRSLRPFFEHFDKLPFCSLVKNKLNSTANETVAYSSDSAKYNYAQILLKQMELSSLPKGLIPFHHYADRVATAFEEHLHEAAEYAAKNDKAHLHFTVAEKPLSQFKAVFEDIKSRVERQTGISFKLDYSFQKKSTDTLAVHDNNQPFRDEEGRLFLRPGGHGALIQNLNAIDADMVFIKNIDNVVTAENLPVMVKYKKALGGMLISAQAQIFELLNMLDKQPFSDAIAQQASRLADNLFGLKCQFTSAEDVATFFNRPLRVCGMVENKGEPGGGPFWIVDEEREVSLQIVESAQINVSDPSQYEILQNSTHFNPVDLVCGLRNYRGEKFDLNKFVNANKGFIAHKSKNGKPLKALELPGLWNGAMGHWNSIFVEVPLMTFNPVKTVIDLLKPGHQPSSVVKQD